jgi:hypothetical protein
MKNFDYFNDIYSVLVKHIGAKEKWRYEFIKNHLDGRKEWQIHGKIGAGKYFSETNTFECYRKSKNKNSVVKNTNIELAKIATRCEREI